jgi:hypothetical protein
MPDSGSLEVVHVAWSSVVELVVAPSSVTVTELGAVVSTKTPSDTTDQGPGERAPLRARTR